MNCYDCNRQGHASPAVAICHDCGAALCARHTTESPHHLTRIVVLNRTVPVPPPQRRVRCETCAAAVTALSEPHDWTATRHARRLAGHRHQ